MTLEILPMLLTASPTAKAVNYREAVTVDSRSTSEARPTVCWTQ